MVYIRCLILFVTVSLLSTNSQANSWFGGEKVERKSICNEAALLAMELDFIVRASDYKNKKTTTENWRKGGEEGKRIAESKYTNLSSESAYNIGTTVFSLISFYDVPTEDIRLFMEELCKIGSPEE